MLLQMANTFTQTVKYTSNISSEEIQQLYIEIFKIVADHVRPKMQEMMKREDTITKECFRNWRKMLGMKDDDSSFNSYGEFTSFIQKLMGVDLANMIPIDESCNNNDPPSVKVQDIKMYF